MNYSNIEFVSLELQRFWGISKNDRDKLRATFGWRWCRRRLSKPGLAAHGRRSQALLYPQVSTVPPYRYASTFMKVLVMARPTPDREDSTRSEGVESSRSGVCLGVTRIFMNVEAYRYGGHRRNLRVQEGLAAAPVGGESWLRESATTPPPAKCRT